METYNWNKARHMSGNTNETQSQFAILKSPSFLPLFVTQAISAFNDNAVRNGIAILIKELVTGIKKPFDLKGINPFIESSIADYAITILTIKQEIGDARMNITTKSLEFVRVLYGGPGLDIVFIIMYTCQGCGWATRYEYDYYVITGGKQSKQA